MKTFSEGNVVSFESEIKIDESKVNDQIITGQLITGIVFMDRETCLCCYIWKLGFKARPVCLDWVKHWAKDWVCKLKSGFRTETQIERSVHSEQLVKSKVIVTKN